MHSFSPTISRISEFKVPYDRLTQAGHEVTVIGKEKGAEVTGKRGKVRYVVDADPTMVDADDFDALVVPGGYSPDELRTDERIVEFVRKTGESGKPIAFICHAGSLLIEADLVRGRPVTSWPSIRTDLINAGAKWVDAEVVEDGNLISSRKPDDLPGFCDTVLKRLS
ncbi:MAG: type 1 glutamine amidotransferase domain-containing protein [Acidimicrobiales bacterium]